MIAANEVTRQLEQTYKATSDVLKAISGGGPFGLTPDMVRATDEWKRAKLAYNRAFNALREHNAMRQDERKEEKTR